MFLFSTYIAEGNGARAALSSRILTNYIFSNLFFLYFLLGKYTWSHFFQFLRTGPSWEQCSSCHLKVVILYIVTASGVQYGKRSLSSNFLGNETQLVYLFKEQPHKLIIIIKKTLICNFNFNLS